MQTGPIKRVITIPTPIPAPEFKPVVTPEPERVRVPVKVGG